VACRAEVEILDPGQDRLSAAHPGQHLRRLVRSQWADPDSTYFYPINGADQQRGIGPVNAARMNRY
jgi:hypothetical protein